MCEATTCAPRTSRRSDIYRHHTEDYRRQQCHTEDYRRHHTRDPSTLPPTFAWKVALVWDSSQRAEANCSCVVEGSAMLETTFSMQLWLHPAKNAHNPGWSIDKDRCIRYGLRLGEHMVSRSSLAKSVVKCLPVEDIPQRLLQRCSSAAWPGLSVCEQERVECEALAWVFSEL